MPFPSFKPDTPFPSFKVDTADPGDFTPETPPFWSNFHPIEDLESAAHGVYNFGKGMAEMAYRGATEGPYQALANMGNEYAAQQAIKEAVEPDYSSQVEAAKLGASSVVPIEPLLNIAKGVGYGTGLTDTPVSPTQFAESVGEMMPMAVLGGLHYTGPREPSLPPGVLEGQILGASKNRPGPYIGPEPGPIQGEVVPSFTRDSPSLEQFVNSVRANSGRPPVGAVEGQIIPDFIGKDRRLMPPNPFDYPDYIANDLGVSAPYGTPPENVAASTSIGMGGEPKAPQFNLSREAPIIQNIIRHIGASPEEAIQLRREQLQNPQLALGDRLSLMREEAPPQVSNLAQKLLDLLKNEKGEVDPEVMKDAIEENPDLFVGGTYSNIPKHPIDWQYRYPGDTGIRTGVEYPSAGKYSVSDLGNIEPQKMQVPGSTNIAMGGGSPRVLQVLGSSLYANDRPTVVAKELLQNAVDEHRISGSTTPIRAAFVEDDINPQTNDKAVSVTIRDTGRGLTPQELYTIFTDVGETGKAGEIGASGGFGFAKAAPMLSGDYVRVMSVPRRGTAYVFEGNPKELINQAKGVPLQKIKVDPKVDTGLMVTTYFPKDSGTYSAYNFSKSMIEHSSDITAPVEMMHRYNYSSAIKDWLETGEKGYLSPDTITSQPLPTKADTISIPGAEIDIHHTPADKELSSYNQHILNKGLYQASAYGGYGMSPLPNVPSDIYANIKATVEEGHPNYPFTANREALNRGTQDAISKWIADNIIKGASNRRIAKLQAAYDGMTQLTPTMVMYDQGGRLTGAEVDIIKNNPVISNAFNSLEYLNGFLATVADDLGWTVKPSAKLKKFGVLFAAPDKNGTTTLGIHIPNPSNRAESAILINLPELMNGSLKKFPGNPVDTFATGLLSTIAHEQAHIPGGGHDSGFSYRDADLRSQLGAQMTKGLLDDIIDAFGDKANANKSFNPEISSFLRAYNDSRGRQAVTDDPLLSTGTAQIRQESVPRGKEINPELAAGSREPVKKQSWFGKFWDFSRGTLPTWDVSGGFRQGRGLIWRPEWRESWGPEFQALLSEGGFEAAQARINNLPIVRSGLAKEAGLALKELGSDVTKREEMLRSTWAEKIPGIRASDRAYTTFLNNLRATAFQNLYDSLAVATGNHTDPAYVKLLADFVNDATGAGKLEFRYGPPKGYFKGEPDYSTRVFNFERAAPLLSHVFFAPRNIASQVRVLNPMTYVFLPPQLRTLYLKSLVANAVVTGTMAGLAGLAGGKVSTDVINSDFMKGKFGNLRLDFGGGYPQYLVAAMRLISGQYTSSTTGRTHVLGQEYRGTTRGDVLENFVANKLHPTARFAWDMAHASRYNKINVPDRILQMYVPMIAQDVMSIANDRHIPPVAGVAGVIGDVLGFGSQNYEKGPKPPTFIPNQRQFMFQGGSSFRRGPMDFRRLQKQF